MENRWCPSDKEVILGHKLINIGKKSFKLVSKAHGAKVQRQIKTQTATTIID